LADQQADNQLTEWQVSDELPAVRRHLKFSMAAMRRKLHRVLPATSRLSRWAFHRRSIMMQILYLPHWLAHV
jgi:hypothetical protein